MPAAYAHYRFGKKVYGELPEKERQVIRQAKDAFLLGLHGPDLLFYYLPICKNRINQQGRRIHHEIAADFFERGREEYRREPDAALRAYLYGYICHFILDSECHPYVSYYMEEKQVGHIEIETELDRYLRELDGRDPLHYVPIHHLISRAHTREQISRMYKRVSPCQIAVCIHGFRRTLRFFTCENPCKARVLKSISHGLRLERGLGGLIMNGEVNRFCQESDLFLEERLERGVALAAAEIRNYSRALDENALLSARLYRNYDGF
ncbi:MAG: zinc dependent phospholipase C family protein [Lachnospiraceae bacterium]|nr:zinc dependent phospholipase C family protein [Lachnospiraceae bacterium]